MLRYKLLDLKNKKEQRDEMVYYKTPYHSLKKFKVRRKYIFFNTFLNK